MVVVVVVSFCVGSVGEFVVLVLLEKFHDEDEDFVGAVLTGVGGDGTLLTLSDEVDSDC